MTRDEECSEDGDEEFHLYPPFSVFVPRTVSGVNSGKG